MNDKELTQDDFLQRIDIRDILLDAGYRQNRRFGLRLSSFIRTDNEGKRIRGDKFVITQHGKCCCQPPQQKEYNSFRSSRSTRRYSRNIMREWT